MKLRYHALSLALILGTAAAMTACSDTEAEQKESMSERLGKPGYSPADDPAMKFKKPETTK